jgi:hypothetical protein
MQEFFYDTFFMILFEFKLVGHKKSRFLDC